MREKFSKFRNNISISFMEFFSNPIVSLLLIFTMSRPISFRRIATFGRFNILIRENILLLTATEWARRIAADLHLSGR